MLNQNTKNVVAGVKILITKASKKDVKFFDLIDEDTFENLAELNSLLNSKDFQMVRAFSVEYRPDFNGKLEKIAS